jgi:hypothetical protein
MVEFIDRYTMSCSLKIGLGFFIRTVDGDRAFALLARVVFNVSSVRVSSRCLDMRMIWRHFEDVNRLFAMDGNEPADSGEQNVPLRSDNFDISFSVSSNSETICFPQGLL